MLATSEASSAITLRYREEPRLIVGRPPAAASSSSGGSLKGDPSIGLTGVESANGFLVETGVAGWYGGGAVADEAERRIGSGAPAMAGFTCRRGLGLTGCEPEMASLYGGATSSMLCRLGSAL